MLLVTNCVFVNVCHDYYVVLCKIYLIVRFCLVCCFVFKQKTAYEMRISDLSSDVCSSDLSQAPAPSGPRRRTGHCRVAAQGRSTVSPKRCRAARGDRKSSCRERVCPYGVDLGGRRIIKKKKRNYIVHNLIKTIKNIYKHH